MKAPAFQWYPKDCDTDENVRAMDDREFGFYMRCLNHAWLNNGLPCDLSELARVMGRTPVYVRKLWERVGRCFVENSGRLVNTKQEDQRREQSEYSEAMREAGAKGAAKRWGGHSHPNGEATPRPIASDSSASASASATAIDTPIAPSWHERFEVLVTTLQERHPKKAGSGDTPRILMEYLEQAVNPDREIELIEDRHIEWCAYWDTEGFEPQLDTWVRKRGWLDAPPKKRGRTRSNAETILEEV